MAKLNSGIDNVGKPTVLPVWAHMALKRVRLIDHKNAGYHWLFAWSISALGVGAGLTWLGIEAGMVPATLAGMSLIILVELVWAAFGVLVGFKLVMLVLNDYRSWRRDRRNRDRSRMQ